MADYTNQEVLLRVEHLCQYFGRGKMVNKAVDDISFDIHKGEVFGLVGESGCGKTTTGRTIIKLYNATSGNVYFKGIRIGAGTRSYSEAIAKARAEYKNAAANASPEEKAKLKADLKKLVAEQRAEIKSAKNDQKNCDKEYIERSVEEVKDKYAKLMEGKSGDELKALNAAYRNELRKAKKTKLVTQIQMIFQDPVASLDPRMTVREIIAEGLRIQGERDNNVINEKVYEMLEYVGLVREHASRYPHEFSGGQRQRIGVARSIIMEPAMIIADEPVSALDVSIQAQVINLLNDLRHNFGITIMFIAHDLSVVKYFSDRIGVMYYGHMVELAESEELFRHPFHPYTQSLLSAIPQPDPRYEKVRQRIVYNPLSAHDYSSEKPTFREVLPGHFVLCNTAEHERIKEQLASESAAES